WNVLFQSCGVENQDTLSPVPTLTPENSTPPSQPDSESISWKWSPGFHVVKHAMEDENLNAKNIQVLTQRTSNYCEQKLSMKKRNKICQKLVW
ncbi:hypothetical protein VP01_14281g1, partial [Puccinia sorghi]